MTRTVTHRRPDFGLPKAKRCIDIVPEDWRLFGIIMRQRGRTRSYAVREFIRLEVERARKNGEIE